MRSKSWRWGILARKDDGVAVYIGTARAVGAFVVGHEIAVLVADADLTHGNVEELGNMLAVNGQRALTHFNVGNGYLDLVVVENGDVCLGAGLAVGGELIAEGKSLAISPGAFGSVSGLIPFNEFSCCGDSLVAPLL